MTKINYLLGAIFISSSLFFTNCSNNSIKKELINSTEFNLIASVENPALLFSINIMDLLKKSNIKESKETPPQFKMLINSQIDQHFNSENQGFELEGNIPFVVSTTDDHKFNYLTATFNVLDAEKTGQSLSLYFDGKVTKLENISSLDFTLPGVPFTSNFSWDDEKLVFILTEQSNSKAIAKELLANRMVDAPENEKLKNFLASNNDFTSLIYMDKYTQMVNQFSKTSVDKDLIEAYKGMILHGKFNFSNGNFKFESEFEGDNLIKSPYNIINTTPTNNEYTNYLSDNGQLIAYGAASFNIDTLANVIKKTNQEYSLYSDELIKMGINIEEINTLFDGEYSISLMDVESVPTEGYEGNIAFNQERPKFLVTAGVKNLEKISTILKSNKLVKPINNYFKADDTYIGISNNKLFISLNEELIQHLSNGLTLPAYKTEFKKPLYGQFITDMNMLPESYKATLLKNNGEEVLKLYNLIEKVEFTGDINNTEFNVDLKDKSVNSFEVFSNAVLKNILPLIMNGML